MEAGDELIEGSINPHDLLRILGVKAVQDYLVKEVQSVLPAVRAWRSPTSTSRSSCARCCARSRSRTPNDTDLLPGSLVDIFRFDRANRKTLEAGGRPASAKRTLLGITKAALATESFLSAASFRRPTRVLTEAAIKGKVDPLLGLKENVNHRQADPRRHRHEALSGY